MTHVWPACNFGLHGIANEKVYLEVDNYCEFDEHNDEKMPELS